MENNNERLSDKHRFMLINSTTLSGSYRCRLSTVERPRFTSNRLGSYVRNASVFSAIRTYSGAQIFTSSYTQLRYYIFIA